ncbi:hypothetical protein Tco_0369763 [Tanacetum coccineum]
MCMSVQKSQVHKTETRSQDDDKRLCLVDDLKEVQLYIQVKLNGTSSSLKSKITTLCSQDEVKKTICKYLEKVKECKNLEMELSKSKTQQTDRRFANLEQHCIELELALQNEKENNVCENSWVKQFLTSGNNEKDLKEQNDSLIVELNHKMLETNDLRAQFKT